MKPLLSSARVRGLAIVGFLIVSVQSWSITAITKKLKHFSVGSHALETINEILDGPLESYTLMIYFDQNLNIDKKTEISLQFLNHSVIVTSITSIDVTDWQQIQTPETSKGSRIIHMLILDDDFESLVFDHMNLNWNPKYLLIINLGEKSLSNILQKESISGITKLVMIQQSSKHAGFDLTTYLPFKHGRRVVKFGRWELNDYMTIDQLFPDRFPSFEGYQFQLGTWFDDMPYLYQSKTGPEGEGDGVEVEMLNAIGKVLNFTYTLTPEPPDDKWGSFENGSWTGMLGMVHRKEKNFTVNYFGITNQRRVAFDSSVSYWNEGFGLSMMTPPPTPKWKSTFYPFNIEVWAGIVGAIIVSMMFFLFLNYAGENRFFRNAWDVWVYILRSIFNNSWPRLPRTSHQRILIGFWFLFCMITTYAYTANLVAFLTVPVYPKRIQTVKQLAESDYGVTMYDYGEFVPGALKVSNDPYYRSLGNRLELHPSYDEAMFPMLNGTHAYIESFSYNRILVAIDYEAKNSYMLKEQLYPGHLCWYFQKNTAYLHKFDDGIQKLVEAGLVAEWIQKKSESFLGRDWERRAQLQQKERKETPLSLEHLQGVFLILLMLEGLAAIVFVWELLFGKLFQKQ